MHFFLGNRKLVKADEESAAEGLEGLAKAVESGVDVTNLTEALTSTRNSPIDGSAELVDIISSPLDIDNCTCWYDAAYSCYSDTEEIADDGDSVVKLFDLSGNANHASLLSGVAVYSKSGGLNNQPAMAMESARLSTSSGFIDSGYGNAITIFAVFDTPTPIHSSLKLKISVSSTSFWMGNNGDSSLRDFKTTGLTGFGQNSQQILNLSGVDYMSVGSDAVRLKSSGVGVSSLSSVTSDSHAISGGSVPFASGDLIIGGLDGTDSYNWSGSMSEVVVFNSALTYDEIRKMETYLANKYSDKSTVVLVGNSLTAGTGADGGDTQYLTTDGDNYPCKLLSKLGGSMGVITDSYGGRVSQQIIDESPYYTGVSFDGSGVASVVWEGTNDLSANKSPIAAFERLKKICRMKTGSGKKVYIGTVLYRGDYASESYGKKLTDQLNDLIRENYASFCDGLIDFAGDARLMDFNDAEYFYTDMIHLNSNGYDVVSDLVLDVISG